MSLNHAPEEDGNEAQICENSWKSVQYDFSCKNANNTLMYEGSASQSHCFPQYLYSTLIPPNLGKPHDFPEGQCPAIGHQSLII